MLAGEDAELAVVLTQVVGQVVHACRVTSDGEMTIDSVLVPIIVGDGWVHPVVKRWVLAVEILDLEDDASAVVLFQDASSLDTGHLGLLSVAEVNARDELSALHEEDDG